MYKVQFKTHNAYQAWTGHGSYGSETSALGAAERISGKYFMVRVLDTDGRVIWSG